MKTLSDDITVGISTTGMTGGYVTTTLYAKGVGVFMGQSYVNPNLAYLYVNLNDIASQNRGRYDYLKLNDDGILETVPNSYYVYDEDPFWSRFIDGLIGQYGARILKGSTARQTNEYVLTGYDYPNKDIRPFMIENNYDSFMGRLMQGNLWIDHPDDDEGSFDALLVPHLPKVATQKFGFGLQLCHEQNTEGSYAIRTEIGLDVSLGRTMKKQSAMTFMTLADFIHSGVGVGGDTGYTPIYLKRYGSSGDEFGDWQEGYTAYQGHVFASEIKVLGKKNGITYELDTYDYGATYKVYMRRYIYSNPDCDWDWNQINSGNLEVHTTEWGSLNYVLNDMLNYEDDNDTRVEIPKSSLAEAEYDHLYAEPVFSTTTNTKTVPDRYIGNCIVALIDNCYSRYYLAWNDRYGDIMSQAFDGKIEYGEDIETDEIKDYKERRKVSHKTVQSKWKLNTKWLSEDVYPMYEAIFTSPYLLLYDTETNRAWNVIVTNSDYKEKTRKNEKSLFNLELEVEANKLENYIF